MTESWLVPVVVELHPLEGARARLLITWATGLRGKMDGSTRTVKEAQVILLEAMSAQAPVNASRWPALKIGSGFEHDW
jgi:hypothetical protein